MDIAHSGADIAYFTKQGQILLILRKQGQILPILTKQGWILPIHTKEGWIFSILESSVLMGKWPQKNITEMFQFQAFIPQVFVTVTQRQGWGNI